MNLSEMAERGRGLSKSLNGALDEHRVQAVNAADAEHVYRRTRAERWAQAKGLEMRSAKERQDWVDAQSADQRRDRDMAQALAQSALEVIRSRRAQMSLLQSEMAAHKSEAEFSRTAPEYAP